MTVTLSYFTWFIASMMQSDHLAADTWDVEVVAIPYGRHGWAAHTSAESRSNRSEVCNQNTAGNDRKHLGNIAFWICMTIKVSQLGLGQNRLMQL